MISEVLILGNGISRLAYDAQIRTWAGKEVWGCNRVFKEYGPMLTRLTGHTDAMMEAIAARSEHHFKYEVWLGPLGHIPGAETQRFTCPVGMRRDSGTTWIVQALTEGIAEIWVAGFDLGGPDIHSPGLQDRNRAQWVQRWREIDKLYGLDRIQFIGYNHIPFIHSQLSSDLYRNRYMYGVPHIPDETYRDVWEKFMGEVAQSIITDGGGGGTGVVRVRFLKGPRAGQETEYTEPIAKIFVARGEIEIVKQPTEQSAIPDPELNAKSASELRKLISVRGLDPVGMSKSAMVAALMRQEV